jgi:hypothetical protein
MNPFKELQEAMKALADDAKPMSPEPVRDVHARPKLAKRIWRIVGGIVITLVVGALLLRWSDLSEGFQRYIAFMMLGAIGLWIISDYNRGVAARWDALDSRLSEINARLVRIEGELTRLRTKEGSL